MDTTDKTPPPFSGPATGANPGLLPAGFTDALPPDAAFEAAVAERLMTRIGRFGYERVNPPLLEFEENLLSGAGAAMADQTFRLMDPVSQRMMGLRADLTPQVARIAATRLKAEPRPLRLCYCGQVLRIRGAQVRPERQFTQVGAELVGSAGADADAEVILAALEALAHIGVSGVSVDLGLPLLVSTLLTHGDAPADVPASVRQALDRKDVSALRQLSKDEPASLDADTADLLCRLVTCTGPAADALETVSADDLPRPAATAWEHLRRVVAILSDASPETQLTIDPAEHRGFEYHAGVTFTLFAKGVRGELGSGGRYLTAPGDQGGEPATGVTLFMDSLIKALPKSDAPKRLLLPAGTAAGLARRLRDEGWITVAQNTGSGASAKDAARDYACTHVLEGDTPTPV